MNVPLKPMSRPYIIWWAIAVHIAWGIALIIDPSVTPVVILVGLHWVIARGVEGPSLGVALLLAASFALVSLLAGKRLSNAVSFILLMPQYGLLLAALFSDTLSIYAGEVGGGRQVDRMLLFTALWPTMIAGVLHSLAIIERHISWNRP